MFKIKLYKSYSFKGYVSKLDYPNWEIGDFKPYFETGNKPLKIYRVLLFSILNQLRSYYPNYEFVSEKIKAYNKCLENKKLKRIDEGEEYLLRPK